MARLFLDNVLDLHSPSTIASDRGHSWHVYLSAMPLDGVDVEVIIFTSTANGPLLPDGSRVRAVGRAVRVGDVVLVRNPALTASLEDEDGQLASLVAPMLDLALSNDRDVRPVQPLGGLFDANTIVVSPPPLLLPGQTHLAGFKVPYSKVPADPMIDNILRRNVAAHVVARELDIMRVILNDSS